MVWGLDDLGFRVAQMVPEVSGRDLGCHVALNPQGPVSVCNRDLKPKKSDPHRENFSKAHAEAGAHVGDHLGERGRDVLLPLSLLWGGGGGQPSYAKASDLGSGPKAPPRKRHLGEGAGYGNRQLREAGDIRGSGPSRPLPGKQTTSLKDLARFLGAKLQVYNQLPNSRAAEISRVRHSALIPDAPTRSLRGACP